MIKIDNVPEPKKKVTDTKEKNPKNKKIDIYKFSEDVLHELSDDNVPSIPSNYSVYFEKMLDEKSDEFRKEIGDILMSHAESMSDGGNINIEKEIKQGFIQIKSMLQAVAIVYKNLNVMKSIIQKRMQSLENNTNILALQNVLSAFNQDLIKLNDLMEKHLDVIKVSYVEVGKMFKAIEEQSIYDTMFEVYNKKFLVASIQSEIESVKRYGYSSSFLFVKIKDKFVARLKNLKDRNNMFKSMSQLLLKTSRRSDIVAHYGDGCFAMVMKYTDENGTKQACKRILNMLACMPWKIDSEESNLDVQVVSSMITKDKSMEELLSNALDTLATTEFEEQPIFLGHTDREQ
ncbi:MAG: diguanylate cyclase [Campylobacter sp.]|nr:diguanylate cyclase [Campylobacter sp.]